MQKIVILIAFSALSGCTLTPVLRHDARLLGDSQLAKLINVHFHSDHRFIDKAVRDFIASVPRRAGEPGQAGLIAIGMRCPSAAPLCTYAAVVPYRLVMPDGSVMPQNDRVKTIDLSVDPATVPYSVRLTIRDTQVKPGA